jgi:hypothetical protein
MRPYNKIGKRDYWDGGAKNFGRYAKKTRRQNDRRKLKQILLFGVDEA